MRFKPNLLIALLVVVLSGVASAADQTVYVDSASCIGAPFGLRLPASMRNVYLIGKIQKNTVAEVDKWENYSATRRTIHFSGLVLGVVTFSNDPDRYLLSYAEVSDARWNRLSSFPIGSSMSTVRQLLGPAAKKAPLLDCGGQVFSDTSIGCCFADSRSKALGDKFPSVECSLVQL